MWKRIFLIATLALLTLSLLIQHIPRLKSLFVNEVNVGSLIFIRSSGKDCDQPDSLRTDCAWINLCWPYIKIGPEPLIKSAEDWANAYVIRILAPETDVKKAAHASMEEKAAEFMAAQEEFVANATGLTSASFIAECEENVLLNNGKYLTLEIKGYSYTGGAHGNPSAAVATFDARTGKRLNWNDLVKDKKALEVLAEATFRTKRIDIFDPSDGSKPFNFNKNLPFALPQNYGLVPNGIYCHYLAYEVGPYSIGSTQFVIPFERLGSNAKIKLRPAETIVVKCNDNGEMELAGKPIKDYDALNAALQALLAEKLKSGTKRLPTIHTERCMMGASSEIRDMYEELKTKLLKSK